METSINAEYATICSLEIDQFTSLNVLISCILALEADKPLLMIPTPPKVFFTDG